MIGKKIGSFEIVEELGSGGMGTVFKALDLMLEREVAIKMLHRELARQDQVVERFRSEAKVLAKLSHPNVATVYSFFSEGEDLFLVLEYVPGETLSRILRRSGALAWGEATRLLSGALGGVAQAHAMGIVHRDLKPANLILTPDGELKVMDFGIARIVGTSHMTRHGHVVGTIEYMSPEQVQGGETDARSDIYSLGVVLYEMLAGRVPFEASSDFELMKAQIERQPDTPRLFAPDIPDWLEAAVLKALAKSPDDRFAAVEELRRVLERGSTPRPARATRLAPRPAKATRLAPAAAREPTDSDAIIDRAKARLSALVEAGRRLAWQHWVMIGSALVILVSLVALMSSSESPEAGSSGQDAPPTAGAFDREEEGAESQLAGRIGSTGPKPSTPPRPIPSPPSRPIPTPPAAAAPPDTGASDEPADSPPTASELRLELFAQRFAELVTLAEEVKRDSNVLAEDTKRFLKRSNRWRPIGRDRDLWGEIEETEKAASQFIRDLKTVGDKYGVSEDGRARRLLRKARRGVEQVGDFFTGDESDADLAGLRSQVASLDRRAAQVESARRAAQGSGSLAAAAQRLRSRASRLQQRFP